MDDVASMLLAIGAVVRLTRLVGTDVITQPLRKPLTGWVLKLVTCGWCASIWIAGLVVIPTWFMWGHTRIWQAIALGLLASWAAGTTHTLGNGKPSTVHVAGVTGVAPLTVFVDDIPDLEEDFDDDEGS